MKFKEFLEDSLEESLSKIKEIQDQIKNLDKDSDTYEKDRDMLVAMLNVYQTIDVTYKDWKSGKEVQADFIKKYGKTGGR